MYFLRGSTVTLRGFMGSKIEPQVNKWPAVFVLLPWHLVITRTAHLSRERAGVY